MKPSRCVVISLALLLAFLETAHAQESPHGTLSAELDCASCHSASAWRPAKARMDFDHNKATRFTLVGRHVDATCAGCHLDLRFDEPEIADAQCADCHVDVHRGNLSGNCLECHNNLSFNDVPGVTVHANTSFPLTGAHLQVSCESCHEDDRGGAFTTMDTDCLTCHENDFVAAQPVDHLASGFSSDCGECHTTLAFTHSVTFDHISVTGGFELVGAHTRIRCESCHDSGMALLFSAAGQNDCIACHESEFQREHAETGFPNACLTCHTQLSWSGAVFDHVAGSGGFVLSGAHTHLACSDCHNPANEPELVAAQDANDCAACHRDDYDAEHAGSGFPLSCLSCHTPDSWGGATFADHDAQSFPIYSGAHRNKWTDCQTCHMTPGNFQAFTCFSCHKHDRPSTDEKHAEVGGYVYESSACLSCHPNGKAD